jgi:hypothetical protein
LPARSGPDRVADARRLAACGLQQLQQRHAARQVREPVRRLLDVPRVDVEHGVRRLCADALDKGRHPRELLDPPVQVVRVQERDPHVSR